MPTYIVVSGEIEIYDSLEEAVESIRKGLGNYLIIVEGVVLTLKQISRQQGEPQRVIWKIGEKYEEGRIPSIALVFDQMFKGFAEIISRELRDARFEFHEILGRGIDSPVKAGNVYEWPAKDDYDVLKIVENLAKQGKVVVFYTGDKKLAKQAGSLGLERVIVEYMPPSEYPGKESIARKMISIVKKSLELNYH